jgi:NAD(P)H-hydrate epimerase
MVRDDMAWTHEKVSAKLYGCGGLATKVDYESAVPTVLDAAALENLPDRIPNHFVLTPHEGEFAKTFPDIKGNKAEKALAAAKKTGAHIVLKGAETVIAAPDGSCVVNRHSSAVLATAGSGDILAGMITGLVAQGMPVFKACAAATWIHGECAIRFGKGLVAEDIIDMLPVVFQDI